MFVSSKYIPQLYTTLENVSYFGAFCVLIRREYHQIQRDPSNDVQSGSVEESNRV